MGGRVSEVGRVSYTPEAISHKVERVPWLKILDFKLALKENTVCNLFWNFIRAWLCGLESVYAVVSFKEGSHVRWNFVIGDCHF